MTHICFSDTDRPFAAAVRYRWPDGHVTCPRCGQAKFSFIKTRKLWFCYVCKKQFTVKVGTIMEDSPLGYDKWMTALWMLANCKNGISSYELGRALGIRQNTAWFMLQRIREAMKPLKFGVRTKLGGPEQEVEADEAFIGAKAKNMHRDKVKKLVNIRGEGKLGDTYYGKTAVQGILDRDARQIRAHVIPNIRRETLQNLILKNVRLKQDLYR